MISIFKKRLIVFLLLFLSTTIWSQQELSMFKDVYFIIVHSSKSYNSAKNFAEEFQEKSELEFSDRGYFYSQEEDRFISKEICDCGENHGYFPRGRELDENFLSIESSKFYPEFKPNYYIVIASHSSDLKLIKERLKEIQKVQKDAYIRKSSVYFGCMH